MKVIVTSINTGTVIADRDVADLGDALATSRDFFRRYHSPADLPRGSHDDWDDFDAPVRIPVRVAIV